ncbi:MAG: hypothetical protein P4L76_03365 [Beijerinckiaceae bacterium]|nr:hypothetical protein [Beijerinckiaceae bacterium]
MRHFKVVQLAVAALALICSASVEAAAPASRHGKVYLQFAHPGRRHAHSNASGGGAGHHHLTALVGDRESGLGFYPPARPYYPSVWREPRRNAVRDSIESQAVYSYYGFGGGVPGEQHAHTVFSPVDGYGTPFFAGYYGPAGDPDEDRDLFGTPYRD